MSDIGIRLGLEGVQAVTAGLQRVQGSLSSLGAGAATLRDAVQGLAPALTAAFTVGGLVTFVRQSINAIDAMNDLADASGASIENISRLDQVARRSGTTLETAGAVLVKFNQALASADGKNGVSIALEAIGVSAKELQSLDPAEALRRTAVALAQFEDSGNKARLVQELFGKSIRDAAPLLNDLALAGAVAANVTAEQAAQAEALNKQLSGFTANVGDFGRALATGLVPTLSAVLKGFSEAGDGAAKFSGVVAGLRVPIEALAVLGANVGFVFGGIGREIGAIAAQIAAVARGDFAGVAVIRQAVIEDGVAARQALEQFEASVLNAGKAQVGAADAATAANKRTLGSVGDLIAAQNAAAEAAKRRAAAAGRQVDQGVTLADALKAQDEGLSPDFLAKLDSLRAAYAASALNADRYAEAVRGLVEQQPGVKKAAEDQAKAVELEARATLDAAKAREKYLEALDASVASGEQELDRLRDEYVGLTAGKEVLAERVLLRLEEKANALELQAIRAADANLDFAEADRLRARAQQLRDEIALRRTIAGVTAGKEADEANKAAADAATAEWQRASDQIGQSLADALMQGGKSAAEYIKGLFRTMILRPIIQAIVQPVVNAMGSMLGMGGGQAGAAGAGGGMGMSGMLGGSSLGAMLGAGSLGSMGAIFGAGSTMALSGAAGASFGNAFAMMGQGNIGLGMSQAAGTVAPFLAAYGIGSALGRMISGGYSLGGGSGNSAINTGAVLGTFLGGPIGTAIGSVLGGVVNRLFGRKLKDSGIEGEFSADGFTGNQFEFYKGGLLASDKTKRREIDPELAAVLDAGAQAANAQIRAYADVLGLPPKLIEGFTDSMRVSLKGLNPEETKQAIVDAINAYQEALAQQFSEVLKPFAEAGETAVETLQRLTILQTFAADINTLGGVFGRVAQAGPRAVQQLAEFAGGLETLGQQITGFVTNYFSADEIAGLRSQEFVGALGDAGIGADQLAGLDTREEFRALVESVDVSTEQGRQQLAALLGQAENFAGLSDYLQETGQTVTDAAMLAPDSDVLAPLFDANAIATDQLSAMTAVEAGVNTSNGLLQQILDQLRGTSGRSRSTPAPTFEDTEVFIPGQAQGA